MHHYNLISIVMNMSIYANTVFYNKLEIGQKTPERERSQQLSFLSDHY